MVRTSASRSACILCGYTAHEVIRTKLRYDIKRRVLQCVHCSLMFLEPARGARQYYAGKEYRKKHGPTLGSTSSMREIFDAYFPFQRPIVEMLGKRLKPSMSVLDVGCSTGHFLAALNGRVKQRVGLELGREEVAFIRKHLNFPVYNEPIETVRIAEGPFDLITALQVLEHVPEPLPFLRGIAQNLKPNGHLYLELPNLSEALLSAFAVKGYEDFYFREPHVFYYTRKTLERLLTKAGFEGTIGTVQRYTLYNHLHWIQTGVPQECFALGNTVPEAAEGKGIVPCVRVALNNFLVRTDEAYKRLLQMYGLGESLTFWGKKKL